MFHTNIIVNTERERERERETVVSDVNFTDFELFMRN